MKKTFYSDIIAQFGSDIGGDRQGNELDPGYCDLCGATRCKLVMIEEGPSCGPMTICYDCKRLITPKPFHQVKESQPLAVQDSGTPQLSFFVRGLQAPELQLPYQETDLFTPAPPKPDPAQKDVQYPPTKVEDPDEFYKEDEPGIYCDQCKFWLQPKMHEVHCRPGERLCTDCLEEKLGIDRFTIDQYYEDNPDTDWHQEAVEDVLALELEPKKEAYNV